MIARFRYRSLSRSQGTRNSTESLSAPFVPLVVRVEQPDKWARIEEVVRSRNLHAERGRDGPN